MPLLRAEAEVLSNNQLIAGVIEEIIEKDEMFALLPFVGVNGKAYVYTREDVISEATFIDPNEAVTEGAAEFTEVIAKLRILAGDVDVDNFLRETMGDTNDQFAVQIAAKAKGINRKFKRTLAIGDSGANAKEFDGLKVSTPAGQTLVAATNGAALTFAMLDELADKVPNGADCFVMRTGTVRAYRQLLYAMGGNTAAMVEIEGFGAVLGHNGKPIVIDDYLPADETQGSSNVTCSVYAARFNETDGFHGIYGGASAGFRIEDIGTVQNKDAKRTRLKWYVGTALKSTKSLARLKGITNI